MMPCDISNTSCPQACFRYGLFCILLIGCTSGLHCPSQASVKPSDEYFLAIKWFKTTTKELGYWEKGMTSVPMVAYTTNDETTHNKVLKHFNITLT